MARMKIFGGTACEALTAAVVAGMSNEMQVGRMKVKRFADGETHVSILENVRRNDVYIIQSTCGPANDALMELLIAMDALRRASVRSITAVVPYYGYARQDRKAVPRTPITAKLVTDMIVAAGASRIVSVDIHAAQIQGFTNVPFDNLEAKKVLVEGHLRERYRGCVVVSPDAGGVERARWYSQAIPDSTLAIIDKRRDQTKSNSSKVMNIIGDVKGKKCLVVDDMFDTAGTLVNGVEALVKEGAESVAACGTHPVLSNPAIERISASALTEVIVTDTIALSEAAKASGRFTVVSVAGMLSEAIRRIQRGDSVSSLFI